jgi:hypothetical protein
MEVNYYASGQLFRLFTAQNLQKTGKLTLRKEIFSDFFRIGFFQQFSSSSLENFSRFGNEKLRSLNETPVSSTKTDFLPTFFHGTKTANLNTKFV